MPHDTTLIATIVVGLVLAFAFGFLANRLRLPPLVGYLLAGVAIGPFTPGLRRPTPTSRGQLAEIGVILLMFGVGLHFSIGDLLAVRRIAIPGARRRRSRPPPRIGAGVAPVWGWSLGAGLVLGLALSVASTVVLLRALEERGALDSVDGRIAVGWLIVEDLAMVLALVLLPALAGPLGGSAQRHGGARAGGARGSTLALTLGKVGALRRADARRRHAASCPGCWRRSRAPARASCSRWPCWRRRSASPTARPSCSASRSRSAPSSPAWC